MGNWFGKTDKNLSFRTTPTKIGKNWYTPNGVKITNPDSYFKAVKKNGTYWKKGNSKTTNWNNKNKSLLGFIGGIFK